MFGYKRVKIKQTKQTDMPTTEFWKAMEALKKAERDFQIADPEYFDVANATLTAAKERANAFSAWMKE